MGLTHNPMAIYERGPGAAAIEYFVVNWMLEKVGWTPTPLEPERQSEAARPAPRGGCGESQPSPSTRRRNRRASTGTSTRIISTHSPAAASKW